MSQSVPPTTPAKRLIAVTVQLSEEHTAMLQKLNQLELNLLREEARADILTHLACGGVEHIVAEDGIRVEPSPKLNALDADIRIATHASREQYYAVRARLSENIPIARTDSLLERLTAKISQPDEGTSTLPQDSQNTWGTILVNVRLSQEHSTQLRNLTDSTVRAALQEEARHDIHECLSRAGLGDAIPIHMIHVTPSMDMGALDVDVHIPKSVRPHEYTSIQTCLSKDIPIPRSARILRGASCSSRSIASDATQSVPGRMPVSEQPVRRDRSREPHSRTASHAPTAATPRSNAATRTGRTSCYVIPVTMKLSTIHSRGLRSINLAQLQELQGFAAQDIYSHLVQFSLGSYIKHEHITVHPATYLNALNVDVKLIAGNGESVHRRLRAALSETIAIPRAGALLERAARSRNATTPKRSNSSNKASRIHTSTQRARSSHSSLRRGSFGGLSEAKSSTSDVFASNVATPRGGPRGRSLASSPTNRCARCVHYTHRGAAPEEPFMKSPRNGGPSNPVSPRGHHNKSQSVTTVPSPRLMKSQNQPPSQHNPPVSLHYNPKELHQSTPVRSPNDGSIAGNGTMNNNSFTHSTPNANRVPSTPSGQAPPNTAERVPVSATLPSSHLVSETMPREQQHHDPGFDPHSSTETRGRPQNSSAEVPINASTPLQDKTNPTNSVGGTPSNAPASTLPVATPYHAFKDHAPSTSVTSSYNHGPSSSVNSGAVLHSTAKTSDDYDPALDSNIRTNPSSSLSSSIHGSQKNTGSVQPSASTVPSALSQSQKDLLYSVPADYVRNPNDSMSSTVNSTVNSVTMLPSSFGDSSSSEVKVNASVSSTQPTSRAIPYHQNGTQSSPSSSLISSQLPVMNSISNSQPSSVTHTMDSVHNTVRSAPSNTASSLSNPTALASKSTTSPSSSFLTSSELLRAHNSTPAQSQPVVGSSISTNTLHEKPEAHSINSEPPVLVASNPDMIPGVVIISPDTRALLDKSSNILSSNYDELKRAIRCDVLVHVSGLPINLQASDVSVVDVTSPFTIQVEVPLRAAATKGSKEQLRLRMNEKISATEFSNVVRRLVS